eukprot:12666003-Prorocentrum_lima.AAC.1
MPGTANNTPPGAEQPGAARNSDGTVNPDSNLTKAASPADGGSVADSEVDMDTMELDGGLQE